jgi:hypothetical protein
MEMESRQQNSFIDLQEMRTNISMQEPCFTAPVRARLTKERLQAVRGRMCALAFPASERIVNKDRLPERIETGDDEMVNDPVAKLRGEDLSVFRPFWYEAKSRVWLISPALAIFTKREQILLALHFKLQSAPAVPFASAAIQLGAVHVFKRKEGNHHSLGRRTHSALSPP